MNITLPWFQHSIEDNDGLFYSSPGMCSFSKHSKTICFAVSHSKTDTNPYIHPAIPPSDASCLKRELHWLRDHEPWRTGFGKCRTSFALMIINCMGNGENRLNPVKNSWIAGYPLGAVTASMLGLGQFIPAASPAERIASTAFELNVRRPQGGLRQPRGNGRARPVIMRTFSNWSRRSSVSQK
ncbi:hypothetical protein BDN72DRAFT_219436 [Pluteus cervinus]|uniref:Uncharacterized protein n=1 Tax=Pluteus cervinus TaxID=181527 RepID=A0ACD3AGU7_9AGAR|nr:hypothetical protein BDN72DRAFT_219436 [Pluteus cervinus]